jgi:glucose-1-phosphate thymidylyltransferase
MTVVGLIPAAGYGTRLAPLAGSKEVLRIGAKPVMDYVVDRMHLAGCSRLRVVTRPEKTDVIAHAEALGAEVILAYPETVAESFAVAMEGVPADDIVLLGFPDAIWEPEDGYRPLVAAVEAGHEIALGLFQAPDLERSDVLSFDASGRIERIHIKPAKPPSEWIWGVAAARARAFDGLADAEWPGSYFDSLLVQGVELHGVPLSDAYLDIGTKDALRRVTETPDELSVRLVSG